MSLSFEKCVHAEHTNSKKTAVNKRKQLTMESGPPRPRRMTCPDSFSILEDKTQTSPKIPEADLSPADNSMADTSTRTPEPTFRHNRRRQNNSVSKIFSTMILNSLPRKTKGDRTPIRQLKRRKMRRANFVLGSPFSFGSCDSSSFGVSPSHCSLSSSLESTCSPRPEQPKKSNPMQPQKTSGAGSSIEATSPHSAQPISTLHSHTMGKSFTRVPDAVNKHHYAERPARVELDQKRLRSARGRLEAQRYPTAYIGLGQYFHKYPHQKRMVRWSRAVVTLGPRSVSRSSKGGSQRRDFCCRRHILHPDRPDRRRVKARVPQVLQENSRVRQRRALGLFICHDDKIL